VLWVFYMVGYTDGINAALAEKDLFSINEAKKVVCGWLASLGRCYKRAGLLSKHQLTRHAKKNTWHVGEDICF